MGFDCIKSVSLSFIFTFTTIPNPGILFIYFFRGGGRGWGGQGGVRKKPLRTHIHTCHFLLFILFFLCFDFVRSHVYLNLG